MSVWMNGKSLMKHHCLKKENFIATKYGAYYRCRQPASKKNL